MAMGPDGREDAESENSLMMTAIAGRGGMKSLTRLDFHTLPRRSLRVFPVSDCRLCSRCVSVRRWVPFEGAFNGGGARVKREGGIMRASSAVGALKREKGGGEGSRFEQQSGQAQMPL